MKQNLGSISRRFGRLASAATTVALAIGVAGVIAPPTSAADFYTPPAKFDATPGAVIRSQPSPLLLQIPGIANQWPGTATRVMYTSTYQDGKPAAVTGTVIEPTAAWRGRGPRPTVVLGPGTVGQGDQCAGSKMMAFPLSIDPTKPSIAVNYTGLEMNLLLLNGVRVAITDYIGMGTPGIHTYVNRAESGHAMLDAARAALRVAKAPKGSPIAFSGYSQGGGAAASAAELASSYAPDLAVKATYAGAPPADLSKVIDRIDGTFIAGGIAYAINGLDARYPALAPILAKETNANGKAALKNTATQCIGDTGLNFGFQRTSQWTRSGESLSSVIKRYPEIQAMIADQRIGKLKPNAPVLIEGGISDDVIPYGQVNQLYKDWKRQGANVTLVTNTIPPIFPGLVVNHALPMVTTLLPATNFLLTHLSQ
ncbi:putative lipase [Gordonia effusa NBRC 100432]|uniref:Putative lipase n=1 Tax=Gordonia effusa NBRC 100432 TaxID=1077974 RepID=H0R1C9_9ACTN|nr:lipase family protein [Gordonia effusa]GAB18880.1 putative lipase [Gordonia effusa NBRC 100432]